VLTNKPYLQAIEVVETIFGTDTFDVIQGQEPDIPRKPDPAGAFRVMKKLDVNPEDCMYFGDTKTDMKTGHAAGLFTVGVTWGFRPRTELEEYHADRILDDPDQIPAAVLGEGENQAGD
jgi:phosphoglycolate phosphatase